MNLTNLDWATIGIILTIVSAVSSLTWWLSGQFSAVKTLVHSKVEATTRILLDKIEYHERHDDDRFSQIREDLSELRIRNAAKDTLMATMVTKLDKINNG